MSLSKTVGPIPVRRQDFDFSNISNHWYRGDTAASTIFNAISIVFPAGEKQFIDTVKYYRADVTDEALKNDIKGFIGQESHHGHQHEKMNDAMKDMGYSIDKITSFFEKAMVFTNKIWSPYDLLAQTTAFEHFTAMLADRFLQLDHKDSNSEMIKVWTWHALEESEHKSVAFDVLNTIEARFKYPRRILAYLFATIMIFSVASGGAIHMFLKDGLFFKISTWKGVAKFLFGSDGILHGMGSYYMAYFRRDFHPWQLDCSHLITEEILDMVNESSRKASSKKHRDVIISHDGVVLS